MAFVPYMVGGYAVDKLMGGNGLKGAALAGLGGAFIPEMLASGAVGASAGGTAATMEAAGSTFPTLLSTAGGAGETLSAEALSSLASQAPAGLGTQGMSMFTPNGVPVGQMTGLFGQEISNQVMNPALTGGQGFLDMGLQNTPLEGLTNNPVTDLLGKGTNYIDEGWNDMSTANKLQTGTGVVGAVDSVTQAPPPIQHQQIQQVVAKAPSPREPFVTQMQIPGGIPVASISEEDRRRANRYSSLLG